MGVGGERSRKVEQTESSFSRVTRSATSKQKQHSSQISTQESVDFISNPGPPQRKKNSRKGGESSSNPRSKPKSKPKGKSKSAPLKNAGSAKKGSSKKARKFIKSIKESGFDFGVGDNAYVILDPEKFYEVEEGEEPCMHCGKSSSASNVPMLECDKCLRGYHLNCLDPPLSQPPESDWFCPVCESGGKHPPAPPVTYRELFLSTYGVLDICRIEQLWETGDGIKWFTGRRYCRPDDTHIGRKKYNGAREVLITDVIDTYEAARLVRPVEVVPLLEFQKREGGEDLFYSEYRYSYDFKSFKRRHLDEDSEEEAEDGDSDTDMEDDRNYNPAIEDGGYQSTLQEAWGKKGLIKLKRKTGPVRQAKRQGGELGLSQMDAADSPRALNLNKKGLEKKSTRNGTLSEAKAALTLTALPKCLPCRDKEKQHIQNFVENFVHSGNKSTGMCLYICGVPGTGKTATVLEIMRNMCKKMKTGELPKFQFVELNGFRLPSPQHLYSHLLEGLTGQKLTPPSALQNLTYIFTNPKNQNSRERAPTVVLVDEMDALVTRNQTVLYNLSEWTQTKGSKLAVIGIANMLDLPERLHARIQSRMGHHRMAFKAYTTDQMLMIIKKRLEGCSERFDELALKMAAAKVSGVSGDVRRALELLRVGIEVCQEQNDEKDFETGKVMLRHVHEAVQRTFQTPQKKLLLNTSVLERLLLGAIVQDNRVTGNRFAVSDQVLDRLRLLIDVSGIADLKDVRTGILVSCLLNLGSRNLVLCEEGDRRMRLKVALNVSHDDVMHVIQNDGTLSGAHRAMGIATAGF